MELLDIEWFVAGTDFSIPTDNHSQKSKQKNWVAQLNNKKYEGSGKFSELKNKSC